MSDQTFTITVNGTELEARPGEMLIEVTDRAGIYIPRFCYHPKLSIAANCRMCLVDSPKAPKPLPACATPVAPGMEVFTRSERAIAAQKATMEFLLINHPLDCPICDQGGECELQDLAMGYGRDVSRFTERKRIVRDKDIGPLISTDMTRCIHCTRCVRFGSEIAGIQELGTIGRGDRMEISTYIEQSVSHELSGNIIDLCPVGALNSKPYRFSARAWEMVARRSIAPHDCLGSHQSIHVLNGRVKRVVPEACEAINETWLSDRDRFGYEGIYAPDRLERPMLRTPEGWREIDWDEALQRAADGLRQVVEMAGPEALGAWVSPSATVEEGYLLQAMLRGLGSSNIDHRLRRQDFRQQASDPLAPLLGMPVAAIEACDAILVVGSRVRSEVPLIAHRLRKAALRGAAVSFINRGAHELLFPQADYLVASNALVGELRAVVSAAGKAAGGELPAGMRIGDVVPLKVHERIAASLASAERPMLLLGLEAGREARFAEIQALAAVLAQLTGAVVGLLSEGANSAGLAQAGVLPHRDPGGQLREQPGQDIGAMLEAPPAGLVLWNVEPEADTAHPVAAKAALARAGFVLAFSPWFGESLRDSATLVLPIGTWAETAGTFVNAAGDWQSFTGVARSVGESRPGWKVLRVLGNRLELEGFDYPDAPAVLARLQSSLAGTLAQSPASPDWSLLQGPVSGTSDPLDPGLYATDPLVRRAPALQQAARAFAGNPAARQPQTA
ncbi:MAG: NADH-quinone oxidoreductase subunit G [Chromatiales bacterium]|nr:NADH-quinone oxidoreductase subunit G [Chromatiales bacterium]